MPKLFQASETWVALAAGVGQVGVALGWFTQDHYNNVLMPAIIYVIGRLTSKAVKPK